jgi:hypothetical protein
MKKLTPNDIAVAYMLISLAAHRGAYKPDEHSGVNECLERLELFMKKMRDEAQKQGFQIDEIEFTEED